MKGAITDLGIKYVPLPTIKTNPLQPRVFFDKEKLNELAESIKNNGLLQYIVLRKVDTYYTIVAGERRYRAYLLLNRATIQARVIKCSDKTAYELTLLENIQRENLSLLEEARGYVYLKDHYSYKLNDLVKVTSKSRSNISNIMSILREDPKVQSYVKDGTLTLAALVWIKQLPNTREKVELLEKLRREEVKRTDVRVYVKKICAAYEISKKLGVDVGEVIRKKGKGGQFDIDSSIVSKHLKFYFIGNYGLDPIDLEFLPSKHLLYSAYTIMYDKGVAKQFARLLLNRDKFENLFMDCGAFTCMKHKQWSFYSKVNELIAFYESVKPTISTSLDIPTFPFLFKHWKISSKEAVTRTLKNAEAFRDWTPSFETTKVYPLQGGTAQEYIDCFHRYLQLGVFEEENIAVAFGGIATTSLSNQIDWISKTTADPDFKKLRPKLKFVHGFGVGNPKRIVALNKYGVDSFDAVTTIIVSSIGGYWLRDGSVARHIIHETPNTRKVRFYFNANSFWGQLTERLAKANNIVLTNKEAKIDFKTIKKIVE